MFAESVGMAAPRSTFWPLAFVWLALGTPRCAAMDQDADPDAAGTPDAHRSIRRGDAGSTAPEAGADAQTIDASSVDGVSYGADASVPDRVSPATDASPPVIDTGTLERPCESVPGARYGTIGVVGAPTDRPAVIHGDINLTLRRWSPVSGATRGLVWIDGPTDTRAPRLDSLFATPRVPVFANVYAVQSWDWGCNCAGPLLTDPEVTLAGMATTPGEVIDAPSSGYDIGDGNAAMVLYAGNGSITLKYTREDNVVAGYTIHIAGLCIEPSLQAVYDTSNASGRASLPVVRGRQTLGRARGSEIQVAIRDTGAWMDPRSRKDWWTP